MRPLPILLFIATFISVGVASEETLGSVSRLFATNAPIQVATPAMNESQLASIKTDAWQRYRVQIAQCALEKTEHRDGCYQQAKRERKQALRVVKSSQTKGGWTQL